MDSLVLADQGENSIGRFPDGSTTNHTGYSCEAAHLVKSWREAFSVRPNSTASDAPFGVVTLAAGTSEGHGADMPSFRQAQMGSYQQTPNPAMPNVFVAAAHDLGDPCYRGANCSGTKWAQSYAHSYMGPIHPRIKLLPAERLATAAAALQWQRLPDSVALLPAGSSKSTSIGADQSTRSFASTGPVFAGCKTNAAEQRLKLFFAAPIVQAGGPMTDTIIVKPYNMAENNSATEVQVNVTGFARSGRPIWSLEWFPLNITAEDGGDSGTTVVVDLSTLPLSDPEASTGPRLRPLAVRFAWADTPCCAYEMRAGLPCLPENCPIFGQESGLPAMPFIATITENGECECQPPIMCNASTSML